MCSVTLNFAEWLEAIFWRSFWHIFWHSFWHIFWHSFWHIFRHAFWHIFLTFLLTYLLTFFLTYQNQNLTSTPSHKKPLCKLYIYLTPRNKSNIHSNFVPVNVIALSASDRPAKRQLRPKMQNACSSTHTHHMHQTAPPKGSWVQKCKRVWSATTTFHGVCKTWSQMLATAVLPPVLHRWPCSARYLPPIHALHPPKTRPKYERLQRASPALARPPHLEQPSLYMPHTTHLFPSTTSSMINIKSPACVVLGGSMHTYMCSAPTKVNL